mgnify:CR=1 FL=1
MLLVKSVSFPAGFVPEIIILCFQHFAPSNSNLYLTVRVSTSHGKTEKSRFLLVGHGSPGKSWRVTYFHIRKKIGNKLKLLF